MNWPSSQLRRSGASPSRPWPHMTSGFRSPDGIKCRVRPGWHRFHADGTVAVQYRAAAARSDRSGTLVQPEPIGTAMTRAANAVGLPAVPARRWPYSDPPRLRHATGRCIGWRRSNNILVTMQHPPARSMAGQGKASGRVTPPPGEGSRPRVDHCAHAPLDRIHPRLRTERQACYACSRSATLYLWPPSPPGISATTLRRSCGVWKQARR